ncbi:MAG: hypothetical protein NC408_09980 [Candidatus Gastranaerophilales bacterium]|nr:hypothetical protein [Candidatus Gastranaerophilales bacterium]
MKKLLGLLLMLLVAANLHVMAAGIEILPTMQSRSNAQDRVWVGTFQLVWNDFMDKIVHNPIRFREGTPVLVQELNKQTFNADDVSDKCYYKITTKITKNTKKQISQAIRKKFKETSDILDKLDLTPRNDKYLIYAMLKKDFEFKNEFKRLGKYSFGEEQTAEYFGVGKNSKDEFEDSVKVLFYNNSDDFAVVLKTKTEDEVYLYKNNSNKEFHYLYADMLKKKSAFEGKTTFGNDDELRVPNISLFEEKSFDELSGRRVMGTNIVIDQAIETVKFDMDSKGVKLKSEAAMTFMKMSLMPDNEQRLFYFNDTFVIFLQEKGKKSPYFALRVHDISKYQK